MKITKTIIACDEGGEKCDNTTLHKVRLTIDGKAKATVVCPKHLAPWAKLRDRGRTVPARAKVYDTPEAAKR